MLVLVIEGRVCESRDNKTLIVLLVAFEPVYISVNVIIRLTITHLD